MNEIWNWAADLGWGERTSGCNVSLNLTIHRRFFTLEFMFLLGLCASGMFDLAGPTASFG